MEIAVSGLRVFAHTGGVDLRPGQTTVMLLHGAGNDHTIWRFMTRRLAGRGRPVVAPDLPGHGKSEGPALASVEDMATWCLDFADAVGAGDLVVVGHSMGSLITMEVATRAPQRVVGVALLATAEQMDVHEDLQSAADRLDGSAADLIVGWTHSGRSRFGHHEAPGMWMAGVNRRLLERNADALPTDLKATAAWDGAAAFSAVDVPTLIVVGERDRMVPARLGRQLRDTLADVELVEVPGGSHASLYDHPSEVVPPLITWFDTLEHRREARD
ncbi:MAG: alpha/beta hydrolase [Acidimicrobiia bacterium]